MFKKRKSEEFSCFCVLGLDIGEICVILTYMKQVNTEKWICAAKKVHGNRYDYSKSVYIGARNNITIVCGIHGEFNQNASEHIHQKRNCPKCVGGGKADITLFLLNANKVHKDRYDYSLVEYINASIPVKIICKEHGIFMQSPANHIGNKRNCPKCVGGVRYTTNEYIDIAKNIHGDNYDYSLITHIKNQKDKIKIICKEHGIFNQTIGSHTNGKSGCPTCWKMKHIQTPELAAKNKLADRIRKLLQYAFSRYSTNGKVMSSRKYGINYNEIFQKLGEKPEGNFHIDHIIPISVFNLDNPEHVRLSHHPENLRWLDATENIQKSDSIVWSLIESNEVLSNIAKEIGLKKDS